MHYDLADLWVDYMDWHKGNLAYAPPSPPGLPSVPSPFRHRTYTLRMIDFESAEIKNTLPKEQRRIADQYWPLLLQQV